MPTAKQYEDHNWMLENLQKAQEADHDNRQKAREASIFVNERDGQWEQNWQEACRGQPQYTFDLTNPMLDQITNSIAQNDYSIKVLPSGGKASKDAATLYDGLVRHIEAISNAGETYSRAGRSMAVKGADGWEVVQAYADSDSFDQDLLIKAVPNWIDRVWFGPHTEPDASDARYAWKLAGLTQDEYDADYPKAKDRNIASVGTDRTSFKYTNREDLIFVGTFYYLKPVQRELLRLSNGKVYENNEKYKALADEHAAAGITVLDTRKRTVLKVYLRVFDNDGWLGEPQESVFTDWLPLVPCYANFDYIEDKVIYWGAVEKMLDWQRVFNYSLSREIGESAYAPRGKYWGTPKQVAGHTATLETLNTNNDPLQLYNPDPAAPAGPPVWVQGGTTNPGLREISNTMQVGIGLGAGLPPANMGHASGYEQSGKAIKALQGQAADGSNKYIEARKISQRQTGRILVNAIPRVYTPGRVVRILAEDGSFDMETIGQEIIDQQTQQVVVLNNLVEGQYDVTCTAGPSFQNRQSETVTAMVELGAVDPSVIQMGGDVIAQNVNAPGMDIVSKRKRRALFMQGVLLPEELTDEERQEMQAMQGQQQPDPNMVLARAEEGKAQAQILKAQTDQVSAINKQKIDAYNAETDRMKVEIEKAKALALIEGQQATAGKVLAETTRIQLETAAGVFGYAQPMLQ